MLGLSLPVSTEKISSFTEKNLLIFADSSIIIYIF
jgi:hypothetical protein